MEKAKIFLSTLTVLGLVGGALAFKAQHRFDGNLRCTTKSGTTCSQVYTVSQLGGWLYCTLTSAPSSAICSFYTRVGMEP